MSSSPRGSLPEEAFMTVDDLAIARTADQMMEASNLGYHIDWESMTVGKGGSRVQIVPGAAEQPSVMRSAEPRPGVAASRRRWALRTRP